MISLVTPNAKLVNKLDLYQDIEVVGIETHGDNKSQQSHINLNPALSEQDLENESHDLEYISVQSTVVINH